MSKAFIPTAIVDKQGWVGLVGQEHRRGGWQRPQGSPTCYLTSNHTLTLATYSVSGQPASSADTLGSDVTSSPAGISNPEELSVEGTRDDWIVPPPPPYHALCSIKEKVY